ncbi:protein of unknown function [Halorientalis persicus]|jgi:hypothetical protein|uniref:DUF4352 domain-containing protein n=1 Tax=Halorientalis persicus TaxID=1367881 RepID=A0A1H8KII6_9EURY|nr:DUF4352 domain-containing protein [Halorientalis persicus]SEN92695.1 protein of unknown function [Halorientalis persicus]
MRTRRRWLRTLGASGLAIGLAGCTGGGSDDTPNGGSPPAGDSGPGDGQTTDGAAVSGRDLGEFVTYTEGDGELRLAATDARLTDYVVGTYGGRLESIAPDGGITDSENENHLFLLVNLRLENTGDETLAYPKGFSFEAKSGSEHERVPLEHTDAVYTFPIPDEYPHQLEAGDEESVWVAFVVPPSTTAGTLVADLSEWGFDDEPSEWAIDVSRLTPQTHDFEGLDPGESATIGNENRGMAVTVRNVREETGSFETTFSGNETTVDPPPEGRKYVLVDLALENVGTELISAIRPSRMSLVGDDWDADPRSYTADDTYNRGPLGAIDPGKTKSGYVVFTVPSDATAYTFTVDVTLDITASWSLP